MQLCVWSPWSPNRGQEEICKQNGMIIAMLHEQLLCHHSNTNKILSKITQAKRA